MSRAIVEVASAQIPAVDCKIGAIYDQTFQRITERRIGREIKEVRSVEIDVWTGFAIPKKSCRTGLQIQGFIENGILANSVVPHRLGKAEEVMGDLAHLGGIRSKPRRRYALTQFVCISAAAATNAVTISNRNSTAGLDSTATP